MAITDLTGTTWHIPMGWGCEAGYGTFIVDGVFTHEDVTGTYGASGKFTEITIGRDSADEISVYYYFGGYDSTRNNTYQYTFVFTGGEDVTHPQLIEWLETWGELISAGEAPDAPGEPKVTKKFVRRYINEIAYSSAGKCFKMLSKEKLNYLTFSSPESFTLATANTTKNWDGVLEYSTDATAWNEWDGTTTLSADNGKLYMRGKGNTVITGGSKTSNSRHWILSGTNIVCEGNIENLLDYKTVALGDHPTMAKYCYSYMFQGCTSLTAAPVLPATILAERCYHFLFFNCTGLITAPQLPATTLIKGCYAGMFYGCTSLTTPPELPSTILADSCYNSMFYGCTSLTTPPELPSTILATSCYEYMFYGCTSLTTPPELPSTILADYCYERMFQGCTSLTAAPVLPATIMVHYCYSYMFQGCTSLTTPPELPSTILADNCYSYMFNGCTSLTTPPELPATILAKSCYFSMFNGCTSLTTARALPVTNLKSSCYRSMFSGCTSLTTLPALPALEVPVYSYNGMFSGCTKIKLSTTQTDEYQTPYRIPTSGTGIKGTAWTNMFANTGGTFTGTPSRNTTYYTSNTVI